PWLPVVQKTNILPSSTPSFAQKYDLSALYSPTLLLWFLFQHAQAITLRTQIVSDMAIFRQLWAAHCAVGLARYAGSIPAVVRFQAKQKKLQHAKCARAFS